MGSLGLVLLAGPVQCTGEARSAGKGLQGSVHMSVLGVCAEGSRREILGYPEPFYQRRRRRTGGQVSVESMDRE